MSCLIIFNPKKIFKIEDFLYGLRQYFLWHFSIFSFFFIQNTKNRNEGASSDWSCKSLLWKWWSFSPVASLAAFRPAGEQSGRRQQYGNVGGAGVPLARVAAGQELSGRNGARKTRQGVPKSGVQVRQAPVAGPQGESGPRVDPSPSPPPHFWGLNALISADLWSFWNNDSWEAAPHRMGPLTLF